MILGGVITATLGWRWVFDINVPIGVVVSLLSIKYISSTTGRTGSHENRHHLDIFGAVSVTAGLMLLVYSLSSAQNIGIGSSNTRASFIVSNSLSCLSFDRVSLKGTSYAPWISTKKLNIWGKRSGIASGSGVCSNDIYSDELSSAGARLFCAFSRPCIYPNGYVFLVVSGFLSARLVNRFGVKLILISGMALQTIGYLFLSPISLTESYFGGLLGPMLLIGLGTGLGLPTINIAALTGTRRGEEGFASGLINTSRQIGGPIGLAIVARRISDIALYSIVIFIYSMTCKTS